MAEKDLPSCSDDSDVDYMPKGEEEALSEEESDDDISNDEGSDKETRQRKGAPKRKRRKLNKGAKSKETKDDNIEEDAKEEKKIDVDSLWADFKQDVDKLESNRLKNTEPLPPVKKPEPESKPDETKESNTQKSTSSCIPKSIPSQASGKPRGLSSILGQLGKKDKLSTLEKSKMDWMNFKKTEGIEEEIKLHNKGKDGYLDKQDFLQRSDLRQFEIEKQLRASKKSF